MKPVEHLPTEPVVVSRIVDLLMLHGIEQQELMAYLGLHRNNFSEWKRGGKRSYYYYIDEIARFFDVSPTFLLRGEDDIPTAVKPLLTRFTKMTENQRDRLLEAADEILAEG